jgi:RNA 3'-terminal phosphate cyclase
VTTVTSRTKLVCPECHHENEAERIYCHACGARLDRSAVAVRNTKESVAATRQRMRKLFDPKGVKLRALVFKFTKVILTAGAVAMIVQMILPPDVPAPVKGELLASQIRLDLEGATARHQPLQLQYTEEQVNAFLSYALKAKQSSLNKPLLGFKRAVVEFGEGTCAVTIERSLFGYSLYTRSIHNPVLTGGKIEASSKGASVGRLAIHPQVSQFIDFLFSDVWSALNREIKLVSKMGAIEFHNKTVVLTAPPGR